MGRQYVSFRLDQQWYGAAIEVVKEVNYLTAITRLPHTPEFVEGVIDLRGEILPVLDLRKRLGTLVKPEDDDTRLMILAAGERSSAVIVDAVDQVLTLSDDDEILAPDGGMHEAVQAYVTGVARVNERLVVILDLACILTQVAA